MRKIFIISIVCLSLLITTTVFAEKLTSVSLMDWYNHSFENKEDDIQKEFQTGSDLLESEFEMSPNRRTDLDNSLENHKFSVLNVASEDIESYYNHYLKELNEVTTSLSQDEFNNELESISQQLDLQIEQDILEILNEVLD